MHGTEDRAVNFDIVKEFVELLQTEGFNVTFKRFEGAGHANYDPKDTIREWIKLHG